MAQERPRPGAPARRPRPFPRTAALGGALVGLLGCAPSPSAAARTLRALFAGEVTAVLDVTAPVVALLALVAWALAGWLLVVTALTAGSRLPGLGGRAGAAALRRVAPATVRRCLEVALGLTVATGAAAGPAAASHAGAGAGPPPPRAATTPLLDWPTTQPGLPQPVEPVVVRPGESLWALAERALGDGATDAQVAATWPAWWSANRAVVGDDPDLLHPGAVLTPPPAG